jgi:hypothetical protein
MFAQDELKNSKFAEYESDAPDNIWHPEFKQEQLNLKKAKLLEAIGSSAPYQSEPIYAPIYHPEIPVTTTTLQSIPEYQPSQPIVGQHQYQQEGMPFHSQLQQAVDVPQGHDNIVSRQQFQSMLQAQPQEYRVNDQASSVVEIPAISFPAAGTKMLPQQLELPAAGTKTLSSRHLDQDSKSRVLAPQLPS